MFEQSAPHATEQLLEVNNLQESGLTDSNLSDVRSLYLRQEARDLWDEIFDATYKVITVNGCPGVGNSVIVFAYAIWYSQNNTKPVMYIHRDEASSKCWIISTGGKEADVYSFSSEAELTPFIKQMKSSHGFGLIVLDGRHSEEFRSEVMFQRHASTDFKLIICTSYQAAEFKQDLASRKGYRSFTMFSWTKQQYVDAVKAGCFKHIITGNTEHERERQIEAQYALAGGSARLFCISETNIIIEILDGLIEKLNDYNDLYSNKLAPASSVALNGLIALYRDKNKKVSAPLSKYVLNTLYEKVSRNNNASNAQTDYQFIRDAKASLPNNPSWQGWVMELEVLYLFKHSKKISVKINNKEAQEGISASHWVVFDCSRLHEMNTDDSLSDLQSMTQNNLVVVPYKWNQALYDMLHLACPDVLNVFQVTFGWSHVNKFQYLSEIVKALKPKVVNFYTIVKESKIEKFKQTNLNFKQKVHGCQINLYVVSLVEEIIVSDSADPPSKHPRHEPDAISEEDKSWYDMEKWTINQLDDEEAAVEEMSSCAASV